MSDTRREYVDGKLICVNFADLDPMQFTPMYEKAMDGIVDDVVLVGIDGKMYVNSTNELSNDIILTFETLMTQTRHALSQYMKKHKKEFKGVKSVSDIFKVENSKVNAAFVYCMIPAELKRREIEWNYRKATK